MSKLKSTTTLEKKLALFNEVEIPVLCDAAISLRFIS